MALSKDQGDAVVIGVCMFAFGVMLLGIIVGLPWLAKQERIACIERNVAAGVVTLEQAKELCQ